MSRIDPGPPVVLVVGGDHREAIERELASRYAADYDIVVTHGLGEAIDQAQWLDASHRRVALVVAEDALPDSTGLLAARARPSCRWSTRTSTS